MNQSLLVYEFHSKDNVAAEELALRGGERRVSRDITRQCAHQANFCEQIEVLRIGVYVV